MTATLTERYLEAATRSIAPDARRDVRAELEASITEAIDARVDQGASQAESERAVLTELGDPEALAAGFADRPLHLIGPRYYLLWWRLLKLLWAIVPAVAMGGVALSGLIAGEPGGTIIGSAVSVGLATAVHLAFWVTLVFFVLERRMPTETLVPWSVDQLPEIRSNGAGRNDLIASLVFLVLGVGAVLWDHFRGFVVVDSHALPVLHPGLWPWWIVGLFALMVAEAALAVAIYRVGRWNAGFAVVNMVLAAVFAVPALWLLAQGALINPDFVAFSFADHGVDADTVRILAIITGVSIVGVAIWDCIDGWLKTARDARQ